MSKSFVEGHVKFWCRFLSGYFLTTTSRTFRMKHLGSVHLYERFKLPMHVSNFCGIKTAYRQRGLMALCANYFK